MAEAMSNSVNEEVSPVNEDPGSNKDQITTLFHQRIEFHLERKSYKVFSDEGKNGFKLETLNPISSEYLNKSNQQKSSSGAVSVSGKVLDESNCGLDPELSFRIYFRRIGAGLQNLGNTCFLNSVLQCLTYTEPLAAYLQSGRHKISCRAAGFCALCAIQKHVSRALESTGRILVPKDLVSNLRCISRNFRNARQEDAHEYMMNLLESMHRCCLPSGVPSESPSAYEKSLVHKIFGGRLRSQVKCLQCSFSSNKFDPFLDLSLEIVKADSLSVALAKFTAQEQLDGGEKQYQCQQCKQKVRALKQLTVHKAPEVLTIHLKRFAAHAPGVKIDKKIGFQPTLDLKRYVTGPHDGNLNYTLYGVLVHAGWSTRSGHYYCFVRTSSGMWYSLDDNQVVQVSEGRVLQQKAYMLFYVRDRRSSVPKKTVDVSQREDTAIKALGNKGSNNFKLGLQEPNRNESMMKQPHGSISRTVAQSEASGTDSFNRSGMKVDSAPKVCGSSENTSIPNAPLSMVSERINGTHPIPKATLSIASENSNGTDALRRCSSLKEDHTRLTSLKVPAVNSADGDPVPTVTDVNSVVKVVLPFQNTHSLDKSVQNNHNNINNSAKNLIDGVVRSSTSRGDANTGKDQNGASDEHSDSVGSDSLVKSVQHNHNNINNSAKNLIDGVVRSSTSRGANTGKDQNGATDEHSDSVGVPSFCSYTSSHSNTKSMQDGGFSQVAGVPDSHCPGNCTGGESKQPEPYLCGKLQDKKLHTIKKRAFKCQTTRLHLSAKIMFGAARRKKQNRRRKHSTAKVDSETVLSDIGPSTSKKDEIVHNSAHSPKGVKHVLDKRVDTGTKLSGSGEIPAGLVDEDKGKTVKQNRKYLAKRLLQKTTTGKLADLRESSGPEHLRTVSENTDTMSMPAGGLKDAIIPRWDGLDPGLSNFMESGGADNFSIGYVGDEWDEEFDRGKRKKIRQSKPAFDGHNPFQEFALKRSKTKKA